MGLAPERNKLARLIALFDQFHEAIGKLDDPLAKRLAESWARGRDQLATLAGVPRSSLAAGLEQGLRELPMIFLSMPAEVRRSAAEALVAAIAEHCPQFAAKELALIASIKARGSIRGEREYHLVRHRVDVLESDPTQVDELQELYRLLDAFEARGN